MGPPVSGENLEIEMIHVRIFFKFMLNVPSSSTVNSAVYGEL